MARPSAIKTETHSGKAYRAIKKTQIIVAAKTPIPVSKISKRRNRPAIHASTIPFHDGFRILWTILVLVKEERPMQFFSLLRSRVIPAPNADSAREPTQ